MSNDTQPLAEDQPTQDWKIPGSQAEAKYNEALQASLRMIEEGEWPVNEEAEDQSLTDAEIEEAEAELFRRRMEAATRHIHGPFTFLMNQNHNALRGCQSCGMAWVGYMAGQENNLCWHEVAEEEE